MKKISTLLIATLLISFAGNSQKNLVPGYIINNQNDTINGFIDYREWYKNPVSILFTQSKESVTQKFRIADIRSFNVTGKEHYKRYTVNISLGRDFVDNIDGKDTSQITDTVFLKVLHEGNNVKLFSYADDVKLRLYILPSGEAIPVELKNSQYLLNGQFVNEKEYRTILLDLANRYVPGDMELQAKIYGSRYFKGDILDISYAINGIKKEKAAQQINEQKSPYRFWVGAGINRGEIKVVDDERYEGNTSGANSAPLIAGGVDIFINPYIRKMFLRTQVFYSTYKTDAYVSKQYFASKENYYFKFKQTNIAIHEELNYNLYNSDQFKYFIGAGFGFNFSSYPLNEQTFIRESSTDTTTIVDDNYIAYIKKFWLSGIIKTGFSVNHVEVFVAYAPKSAISSHASYALNNSSLRLQVNYLFKK